MTIKSLTGLVTSGYTLSNNYTGLVVQATGTVDGGVTVTFRAGTTNRGTILGSFGGAGGGGGTSGGFGANGGEGLSDPTGRSTNTGTIGGGLGGDGGFGWVFGGGGGSGGLGVGVSTGGLNNQLDVYGGQGGVGAYGDGTGGVGGAGGGGVTLAGGAVVNSGTISGGLGGTGGSGPNAGAGGQGGAGLAATSGIVNTSGAIFGGQGGHGAHGEIGGAGANGGVGVTLATGVLNNNGTIAGGQGGAGGTGVFGGGGGSGGAGVVLGAGSLDNKGAISGGLGALGGTGYGGNGNYTGANGVAGDGVILTGKASVLNGAGNSSIVGLVGLYAASGSVTTITNFGAIQGTGGVAVQFTSASDRLIAEVGSVIIGKMIGDGGTLDLAQGTSGTIDGLGGGLAQVGSSYGTASGFGVYDISQGSSWALAGVFDIASGVSLTNAGTVTNEGDLDDTGAITGAGTLNVAGGVANFYAGATVGISDWLVTGGTVSIDEALTFRNTFIQSYAATVDVAAGEVFGLAGSVILAGALEGPGLVSVATATVNTLTVGGGATLSVGHSVTQSGEVTLGDPTGGGTLSIGSGGAWVIGNDSGIAGGGSPANLTVRGGASLIKSGGTGISVISVATTDTGVIEAAMGTIDFTQGLTGTGKLNIDTGAVVEVDATAGPKLTVNFANGGATLAILQPAGFAATISGVAIGDTIDLLGATATGASVNARNQLVIVENSTTVATLQLSGNYAGATFSISPDAGDGVDIELLASSSAPPAGGALRHSSPGAFVSAMAGLGSRSSAAVSAQANLRTESTLLAAPKIAAH